MYSPWIHQLVSPDTFPVITACQINSSYWYSGKTTVFKVAYVSLYKSVFDTLTVQFS